MGVIIAVLNLILLFVIRGRISVGISGAGTLFVFVMTLRFFYYAIRMLGRMWGAVGVLVGVLNAVLPPFYFMYLVYFVVAGNRGNGVPPVSAKKVLVVCGIVVGALIVVPIVLVVLSSLVSGLSESVNKAAEKRAAAENRETFRKFNPEPKAEEAEEIRRLTGHLSLKPELTDDSDDFPKPPRLAPSPLDPNANGSASFSAQLPPDSQPSNYASLKYALDADGKIKIAALKSEYFRQTAQKYDANLDGLIEAREFGALKMECPAITSVDHSQYANSDAERQDLAASKNAASTVGSTPFQKKTPEEKAAEKAEQDAQFNKAFNKTLSISEFVDGKLVEAKSVGDQGVPLEALKEAGFPEDIQEIYRQVDKNGDGFISHSEDSEAFHLKHELRVKKMREN